MFVSVKQGSVSGVCVHVGDLHGKTNGAETCSSCVLLESSPTLVLLSEVHPIRQEAKKRNIMIIIKIMIILKIPYFEQTVLFQWEVIHIQRKEVHHM